MSTVRRLEQSDSRNQLTIEQLAAESNLGGIKRLLDDTRGTAERLLRFKRALTAPIGNDQYEVPSPSLLAAAEEVVRSGISLQGTLAILEKIKRECDAIAREFVQLFLREVWKPFHSAGMPAEQWPEIERAIERLRPIASEATMMVFHQRMSAQVEAAFGEITRRLSAAHRQ